MHSIYEIYLNLEKKKGEGAWDYFKNAKNIKLKYFHPKWAKN